MIAESSRVQQTKGLYFRKRGQGRGKEKQERGKKMGCSAFSSRNSPFNEFLEASLYNLLFYILLFHQDSFLSPEFEKPFTLGFQILFLRFRRCFRILYSVLTIEFSLPLNHSSSVFRSISRSWNRHFCNLLRRFTISICSLEFILFREPSTDSSGKVSLLWSFCTIFCQELFKGKKRGNFRFGKISCCYLYNTDISSLCQALFDNIL